MTLGEKIHAIYEKIQTIGERLARVETCVKKLEERGREERAVRSRFWIGVGVAIAASLFSIVLTVLIRA